MCGKAARWFERIVVAGKIMGRVLQITFRNGYLRRDVIVGMMKTAKSFGDLAWLDIKKLIIRVLFH